jgi:DNA-binding NtrC family response regulator
MDDLRREFEVYRRDAGVVGVEPAFAPSREILPGERVYPEPGLISGPSPGPATVERGLEPAPDEAPSEGSVIYRPGMTMEEMEREAIRLALDSVAGNRRKAAELLGIGERTLYRKISSYGLDA